MVAMEIGVHTESATNLAAQDHQWEHENVTALHQLMVVNLVKDNPVTPSLVTLNLVSVSD